jgi:hypothetical protein
VNELANRTGTLQAPQLDYILVDGSSSMMDKWWDSIGALDNFLNVLRDQNIHSQVILHTFDSQDIECVQRDCLLKDVGQLADVGAHWGMTPLYDAINLMTRKLAALDPPKCSIVIVTDGEDTSSKVTDVVQARALLDWCRAKGWQVTFIGADFNNMRQAAMLGADASNSIGVQKAKLLEAGRALGAKRVHHAQSGEDINFSEEERKTFGGYLTNGNGESK